MKYMLALLPVALAAQAGKVYYLSKLGVSCSVHDDSGVTNCVQGQVHDAETVRIPLYATRH